MSESQCDPCGSCDCRWEKSGGTPTPSTPNSSGNPNASGDPYGGLKLPVLGAEYDDPFNIPDIGKTFILRPIAVPTHRLGFNRNSNPNLFLYDGNMHDDQFWTLEKCTGPEHLGLGGDPLLKGCLGHYYLRNNYNKAYDDKAVRIASTTEFGTYGYWEGPFSD